ncbi:DExH-box ATP-dependent RNA helicase DExH7, chloroplastic-like [Pistacia vera]|uniref:DExH-box ATP-dependent RNA helicase DExH7, chloroplastic-like n=1 Tax=Pistacia vera TaxID=55513 RepID=UPI001262E9FD|nr:DExH-box ATP-dependent RNA helicase DExH7, chloroplastic-like [Pistacia vera]
MVLELNLCQVLQFDGNVDLITGNRIDWTQKAKKLKAVYEKLFCAGFSYNQIELALSSLKDDATFEAALDWLCLNLPGNELPLKFSTGTSQHLNGGASVSVISVVRDWIPSDGSSANTDEEVQKISVRTKGHQGYDALDSRQPSQADWIRQYMEQQEEEEYESWEDYAIDKSSIKEVSKPRSYDVIAREYLEARLEATKAKEKRDKKSQEQAGDMIRKLKQELSALGLLDNALASDFELERASAYASAIQFLDPCLMMTLRL